MANNIHVHQWRIEKEGMVYIYRYILHMYIIIMCVYIYIYIYIVKYYSAMNKHILSFVTTQMNLEGIMLNETSQSEKDKYCIISLACGI